MSDYTTQLRFICESYAGRTEEGSQATDVDDIIALARPHLFDFEYPIFDDTYKPELESKIINHFYTQEIGQETVGLFKQRLKTKMREIMPYYNQLYLSERLKFDPFKNADYVDLHNQSNEGVQDNRGTLDQTNTGVKDISRSHVEDTLADTTKNGTWAEHGSDEKDGTVSVETENNGTVDTDTTNTNTNTVNLTEKTSGSNASVSIKDGTEMGVSIPAIDKRTLVKTADTPLGQISSGSGADAQHNAGIGPGGINGGYLSGVQETVENFNGEAYTDSNDKYHPRNHDYNETRYGLYYDLSKDGQKVMSDQRHDDGITIAGAEMTWEAAGEGETHGHWHLKRDQNGDISVKDALIPKKTNTGTTSDSGSGTVDTSTHDTGESDTTTHDEGSYSKSGETHDTEHFTQNVTGGSTEHETSRDVIDNDTTSHTDTKSKLDYFGKVFGKVGSETYSEMLQKFRATFLNIDMDVIHELEPLFMMVW